MTSYLRLELWRNIMVLALALFWGGAAVANPVDHARITELRRELARHDELYYRQAAPEISDAAYDALKAELRRLEEAYPNFGDTGSVTTVGDDRTEGFPKHQHRVPMLSLDKATSDAELAAFHERAAKAVGDKAVVYRVEPKFDGVAVSLVYEDGRLTRAVTRGDGTEGDDITANVRALCGPPETLGGEVPALVEVRGELFVDEAEFARINDERAAAGEALFANPRNLAAGSVKALDPATITGRRLRLVCYGWGAWEPAASRPASLSALHGWLAARGLPVVEAPRLATGLRKLRAAVEAVRREREKAGFPTDGVVVKLESVSAQERLGVGAGAPRWAVARKFPAERAATRVLAINWQVGRTGALTPVAELQPVTFAGSTVARASLHNAAQIAALDVRVGDRVWIEKAGEIIPVIMEVDLSARAAGGRPYAPPVVCPVCGTGVVAEGVALRCPQRGCPAQVVARVGYFASKAGVDIRGLGPARVALLVERGLVGAPADLYWLDAEVLAGLPGLGRRSAARLTEAIAASRAAEWEAVLRALGLPGVGAGRAEWLARAAGDWDALLTVDAERLAGAGFPEEAAQELAAYLAEEDVRAELRALAAAGVGRGGSLSLNK